MKNRKQPKFSNIKAPTVKINVVGYYSELTRKTYKHKFSRKISEIRTKIKIERKKSESLIVALLKVVSLENAIGRAYSAIKENGYSFKRYTHRIKCQMRLREYKYSLSSSLRSLLF